jgi:hypothetical protein
MRKTTHSVRGKKIRAVRDEKIRAVHDEKIRAILKALDHEGSDLIVLLQSNAELIPQVLSLASGLKDGEAYKFFKSLEPWMKLHFITRALASPAVSQETKAGLADALVVSTRDFAATLSATKRFSLLARWRAYRRAKTQYQSLHLYRKRAAMADGREMLLTHLKRKWLLATQGSYKKYHRIGLVWGATYALAAAFYTAYAVMAGGFGLWIAFPVAIATYALYKLFNTSALLNLMQSIWAKVNSTEVFKSAAQDLKYKPAQKLVRGLLLVISISAGACMGMQCFVGFYGNLIGTSVSVGALLGISSGFLAIGLLALVYAYKDKSDKSDKSERKTASFIAGLLLVSGAALLVMSLISATLGFSAAIYAISAILGVAGTFAMTAVYVRHTKGVIDGARAQSLKEEKPTSELHAAEKNNAWFKTLLTILMATSFTAGVGLALSFMGIPVPLVSAVGIVFKHQLLGFDAVLDILVFAVTIPAFLHWIKKQTNANSLHQGYKIAGMLIGLAVAYGSSVAMLSFWHDTIIPEIAKAIGLHGVGLAASIIVVVAAIPMTLLLLRVCYITFSKFTRMAVEGLKSAGSAIFGTSVKVGHDTAQGFMTKAGIAADHMLLPMAVFNGAANFCVAGDVPVGDKLANAGGTAGLTTSDVFTVLGIGSKDKTAPLSERARMVDACSSTVRAFADSSAGVDPVREHAAKEVIDLIGTAHDNPYGVFSNPQFSLSKGSEVKFEAPRGAL